MSCLGLKQKRQKNITPLHPQPLDTGQKLKKLEVSNSPQEDINTGLKISKQKVVIKQQESKQLSMPESQVKNNVKTLKDKKNILSQDIQPQNSSQILVPGLITKELSLEPFFKPYSKEISKKLWLPIKTDLLESALISSSGYLLNSGQSLQAWKMTNTQKEPVMTSQMTSWQLSQSLVPDTMVVESIKKPRVIKKGLSKEERKLLGKMVIMRSKKFKIKFNSYVSEYIKLCFDAYDTYYNLAIKEINKRYFNRKLEFENSKTCIYKECKKSKTGNKWHCTEHIDDKVKWELKISTLEFRKVLPISNESILANNELKQFINIPYDLRNEAIEHAIRAYKSATSAVINKTIDTFILKEKPVGKYINRQFELPFSFLTISNNKIEFCKYNIKKNYKSSKKEIINTELLLSKKSLNHINEHYKNDKSNIKIYKTKTNKYYLILTRNVINDKKENIQSERKSIVSLDPGIRTFQTCYDPTGMIIESGTKIKNIIHEKYKKINSYDKIINDKENNHKRRKRYRELKLKKYEKITNIVDNTHNQLISYLTKNYNNILAPQLPVQKLVRKTEVNTSGETVDSNRVLTATNSRLMNTFAFYRFHQKLKSMCGLRKNKLYIVDESYTSKTCGLCGTINNNLGGLKTFKCINNDCKIIIDRDYNGSRNILLKHLI